MPGDSRKFERQRIGQHFMSVVALDAHGVPGGNRIDQPTARQPGTGPIGFVPASTQNPFLRAECSRLLGDTGGKLSFVTCVFQTHLRNPQTPKNEVDMAVDEPRHSHAPFEVENLCVAADTCPHLLVRTDGHKSSVGYGNCFGKRRRRRLPRPDLSIQYDKFRLQHAAPPRVVAFAFAVQC